MIAVATGTLPRGTTLTFSVGSAFFLGPCSSGFFHFPVHLKGLARRRNFWKNISPPRHAAPLGVKPQAMAFRAIPDPVARCASRRRPERSLNSLQVPARLVIGGRWRPIASPVAEDVSPAFSFPPNDFLLRAPFPHIPPSHSDVHRSSQSASYLGPLAQSCCRIRTREM